MRKSEVGMSDLQSRDQWSRQSMVTALTGRGQFHVKHTANYPFHVKHPTYAATSCNGSRRLGFT